MLHQRSAKRQNAAQKQNMRPTSKGIHTPVKRKVHTQTVQQRRIATTPSHDSRNHTKTKSPHSLGQALALPQHNQHGSYTFKRAHFASTSQSDNTAATATAAATETKALTPAERIVLTPEQHKTFNRWGIVPAAVLTHISLGSIFAWSIFNQPLMLSEGVIEAAASDWTLPQVLPVFSTTMACFGLSSFALGRIGFHEKYGPKVTNLLGAGLFGSAFTLASVATTIHSLPLLYFGYGVLGGLAVGTAYVGPISTLMRWFPDKKGLASAMAVMGFGAGGIFAAQFIERFLGLFKKMPQYVGNIHDYPTQLIDGKLKAMINGKYQDVVVATESTLKKLGDIGKTLQEGVYLVGTGDVGISNTFLALGALYTVAIGCAAMMLKLPHARYDPTRPDNIIPQDEYDAKQRKSTSTATAAPASSSTDKNTPTVVAKKQFDYVATRGDLSPAAAIKTKQFWLLWTGMLCNSAAAYAIIGGAKTIMTDVYATSYPLIVSSAFAATFVSMISAFNLGGRLGWGAVSDRIGRKNTFNLMWGLGVPFYLGIPLASHLLEQSGTSDPSSILPLALFYASVVAAISNFGGSAAVSPAYLSDLFGSKYAAANAGQLLSYLMVSGFLGPMTATQLHTMSTKQAIEGLVANIDIATFTEKFGASPDHLNTLISNKQVTIPKLMEIAPQGTVDPTPHLYDTAFITMAGLQAVAFLCNQGIKKVDDKHFDSANAITDKTSSSSAAAATTTTTGATGASTTEKVVTMDDLLSGEIIKAPMVNLDIEQAKAEMKDMENKLGIKPVVPQAAATAAQ